MRTRLQAKRRGSKHGQETRWLDWWRPTATNVSVLKEWSGKGIAGDLLKWCVEHVKAMGMRQVNLKVAIDNTVAIRLYEQNGFVARKLDAPFTTMNLCLKSEQEYGQQA